MRRRAVAYALLLLCQVVLSFLLVTQRGLVLADPASHTLDWRATWGGDMRDYSYDATVTDGALYVTGATYSEGETPVRLLLMRYETNGTLTWNETYGVGGYAMGRGIVSNGMSLYVAGIRIDDRGARSLLLKYDLDGRLIWEREWSPGANARASGIDLDAAGNVYVTGYVEESPVEKRTFLLKYDAEGSLAYSQVYPAEGTDTAWGLTVGDAIYICGESTINATAAEETGVAAANALLMKVSLGGDLIWRREARLGHDNVANSVYSGNGVTIAGYSSYLNGTARLLLLRYDDGGELLSQSLFGSALIEDMAWGVAGAGDYTYVVGHTRPLFTDLGDASIQKLGPRGDVLWADTYSDYSTDMGRAVAISGDDVYLVGETYWRNLNTQVLVLKYVSANAALSSTVSTALRLSPLATGSLLLVIAIFDAYIMLRRRPPADHYL
jgi:hypothetical protein